MPTNTPTRAAAVLVALEGAGLVALAAWQIGALFAGDSASIESSLALVVLTAVGAVAVIAFAVAIWRGQSWGRSGGILTQLLMLAVAWGAATGAYAHPSTALILAVPAIVALVLLVLAVRDAGRGPTDSPADNAGSPQDPPRVR
jgi:hypothetical protein